MTDRICDNDTVRFFLQWLRQPAGIGAVVPSGPALAGALAGAIDTVGETGAVVELGPGTGRVTAALLATGVRANDLVVVERNAGFCDLLGARFPGIRIVPGEAADLARLLFEAGIGPVRAVVSSLPLLSMSRDDRRVVLTQAASVLGMDGVLVQYTYGPAAPVPPDLCAELSLAGERTDWVLANIPPAAVWSYRHRRSVMDTSDEVRETLVHTELLFAQARQG